MGIGKKRATASPVLSSPIPQSKIIHHKTSIPGPMSRRFKALLLGTIFLLLAIPAVYIALSWQPEDPIEFRFVEQYVEESPGSSRHLIELEAVNRTPWPVDIYEASLVIRPSSGAEEALPQDMMDTGGTYGTGRGTVATLGGLSIEEPPPSPGGLPHHSFHLVPAGGKLQCTVHVHSSAGLSQIPADRLVIVYQWQTKTKEQYGHLVGWLSRHLPKWVDWYHIAPSIDESWEPLSIPGHPATTASPPVRR